MARRSGCPLLEDDPALFDIPPERLLSDLPSRGEVRDDGIGLRSLISDADGWSKMWTRHRKQDAPRARRPRPRVGTRSRYGVPQAA